MNYADLCAAANVRHLSVVGAFHPSKSDLTPEDTQTLVLLAPAPRTFWNHFTTSHEFRDGQSDPMDRWSRRVIGQWACELAAKALFPFGGPPYQPFLRWAIASGRAWHSPTGPLVHETMGMMISYRGALALKARIALPPSAPKPCDTCSEKPCLTICPVGALSQNVLYDVLGCKKHIRSDSGQKCRSGCLTRTACPISQGAGRASAQSAFQMNNFLRDS